MLETGIGSLDETLADHRSHRATHKPELECRSNWRIYIEEMAQALTLLSGQPVSAEPYATADPMTPFEKKYLASGHELWRCQVSLT